MHWRLKLSAQTTVNKTLNKENIKLNVESNPKKKKFFFRRNKERKENTKNEIKIRNLIDFNSLLNLSISQTWFFCSVLLFNQ